MTPERGEFTERRARRALLRRFALVARRIPHRAVRATAVRRERQRQYKLVFNQRQRRDRRRGENYLVRVVGVEPRELTLVARQEQERRLCGAGPGASRTAIR